MGVKKSEDPSIDGFDADKIRDPDSYSRMLARRAKRATDEIDARLESEEISPQEAEKQRSGIVRIGLQRMTQILQRKREEDPPMTEFD